MTAYPDQTDFVTIDCCILKIPSQARRLGFHAFASQLVRLMKRFTHRYFT